MIGVKLCENFALSAVMSAMAWAGVDDRYLARLTCLSEIDTHPNVFRVLFWGDDYWCTPLKLGDILLVFS